MIIRFLIYFLVCTLFYLCIFALCPCTVPYGLSISPSGWTGATSHAAKAFWKCIPINQFRSIMSSVIISIAGYFHWWSDQIVNHAGLLFHLGLHLWDNLSFTCGIINRQAATLCVDAYRFTVYCMCAMRIPAGLENRSTEDSQLVSNLPQAIIQKENARYQKPEHIIWLILLSFYWNAVLLIYKPFFPKKRQ